MGNAQQRFRKLHSDFTDKKATAQGDRGIAIGMFSLPYGALKESMPPWAARFALAGPRAGVTLTPHGRCL